VLTAAHVVGALGTPPDGTEVMYVAGFGVGATDRPIGTVVLSHPEEETSEVLLDAALVATNQSVTCTSVVNKEKTSRIPRDIATTCPPGEPLIVHKRGWKTDRTVGLLDPEEQSLDVDEQLADGTVITRNYLGGYFVVGDQEPFAEPGDSGAVVVDEDDCVLGMIVALRTKNPGTPSAEDQAFVVPIDNLITTLDIELLGPDRQCTLVNPPTP
jgi:hypothetical protein